MKPWKKGRALPRHGYFNINENENTKIMISYFDPEKAKDCDWISAKAWVRMVDRAIRMAGRNQGNLLKGIVNCFSTALSPVLWYTVGI